MKTNYNVTGAERKALVQTISDHLGEKAKYRGMPSCAYLIGDFTVTKDGTLEFDDCTDSEIVEGLYEAIATAGFAFEEPAESATAYETADPAPLRTLAQEGLLKGWEEPVEESPAAAAEAATVAEEAVTEAQEDNGVEDDTEAQETETTEDVATEAQDAPTEGAAPDALTISLPMTGHTVNSLRNLVSMIYSRGALLSKATGGSFGCPLEQVEVLKDCMTVEDAVAQITEVLVGLSITDDSLTFAFPATDDAEKVQAFTQLAVQIGKAALEMKRVMAKEVDTTNEKYIFRLWLLSLGMGGDEFKNARRVLLAPLSGNAAFKDAAMEQHWKEKRAAERLVADEQEDR